MEKTYKRVPFDIELAKKVQSGEVEGRIVTEEGELVRILCFNREHYCNILALRKVPNEYGESILCAELNTGRYHQRIEEEPKDKDKFLFIELPEEAPKHNFIVGESVKIISGLYCGKHGIIEEIIQEPLSNKAKVSIGANIHPYLPFEYLEKCSEDSKKETPEHEFKPFDKVLVRCPHKFIKEPNQVQCRTWIPAIYYESTNDKFNGNCVIYRVMTNTAFWDECIPYEGNEHLVGTADNIK